jgi:hypothetical protein
MNAIHAYLLLNHFPSIVLEPFEKPIAQIKKFKIPFASRRIGKLAHSPAIGCVFRLNQTNFKSFFFTREVYQRVLLVIGLIFGAA